jgi:hypothetical protein
MAEVAEVSVDGGARSEDSRNGLEKGCWAGEVSDAALDAGARRVGLGEDCCVVGVVDGELEKGIVEISPAEVPEGIEFALRDLNAKYGGTGLEAVCLMVGVVVDELDGPRTGLRACCCAAEAMENDSNESS